MILVFLSLCLFNQGNFVRIIEGGGLQDNTVKMIPYENHILGINTQYPENWTKHEDSDNVRFFAPQQNTSDNDTEQLKIASFVPGSISFFQSEKTSLPILANNTISYLNQTKKDFDLLNTHPATTNGMRAHILEYMYTSAIGPTKSLGLLIPNGGNLYFISYFADPAKYSTLLPLISNMINSTEVGIFDSGGSSGSGGNEVGIFDSGGSSGSGSNSDNSGSSSNCNDNRGNCNHGSSGNNRNANDGSTDSTSRITHRDNINSNDGSSGNSADGNDDVSRDASDCSRTSQGCIEPDISIPE